MSTEEGRTYHTPQPGGFTQTQSIIGFLAGILLYTISFTLCWHLMNKYWPRFRKEYSLSKKADNCSRFSSCLNCVLVTPILLYGMVSVKWGPYYEPLEDPWIIQVGLYIAMGYFLQDIYVTLRYKTPLWPVFILHHCAAVVPYAIYFLKPECNMGVFILACFMLVESTNVFYNVQQWLEDVGRVTNGLYVFLVYSTVVGWFFFRLINVSHAMYAAEKYIIPSTPPLQRYCLQPGRVCGYFVNVFCYTAFCVRILRDVIVNRWLNDPKKMAAKKSTPARPVNGRRREGKKEM